MSDKHEVAALNLARIGEPTMAKVRFLTGPKAGTIEHIKPQVAETLVAAGLAELIPYKNYVERLKEEEEQRQRHIAADKRASSAVTFTAVEKPSGKVYIERRFQSELTVACEADFRPYNGKSARELFLESIRGCPAEILAIHDRLAHKEDPAVVAERIVQDRMRLEAEQKKNRELEAAGVDYVRSRC
jgi:hypothetical protein